MSFPPIYIRCNGCDFSCLYFKNKLTLKCSIGNEVATYDHTTAWCNRCGKICDVEYIPALDELILEYNRRLKQVPGTSGPHRWSLRRIKEFKDRITWRKARKAPPHCLACGSIDITPVEYEEHNGILISKSFRHKCGGSLFIDYKNQSHIFMPFEEEIIWLDIEGNKLENIA